MNCLVRSLLVGLATVLAVSAAQTQGLAPLQSLQPFENTMAQRVLACTGCHGKQGRAGPDGYYPRLAGKPVGYLYNQLNNFQSGRRHYAPMVNLLQPLSGSYLRDIAEHFSSLDVPYEAPSVSTLSPQLLERGRQIATVGVEARQLPACTQCHSDTLMGLAPFVPSLLGLPPDYLNAQLGAWRSGERRAAAPDCMAEIAKALSSDEIQAVVGWLAAQPVPRPAKAATSLPKPMPAKCGSIRTNWVAASGVTP